jgi:carboxypeptidase Ss1
MKTGLLAELKGSRPGPTVAIRTDIDALPIAEQTGLSYKSKKPNCMHACGHDAHMATVLGVAKILTSLKDNLPGSVRFIFQPAEEQPPGGAVPMIKNGALDGVSMIFGLHVEPGLPTGKISLRDGVTMGSVTDIDITIHGRGGHAARPHASVDAISTAAEVVESIQKVVSREIDPVTPTVITFGQINGGGARNVIADRVTLVGTARALSVEATKVLPKLIKRTVQSICKARGARADVTIIAGYPLLANHASANRILRGNFAALFNEKDISRTPQTLGGEDFAFYLQKVPGAMFRLGVMNKKIGADKPWHSPEFKIDEDALYYGTALMTAATIDVLTNGVR